MQASQYTQAILTSVLRHLSETSTPQMLRLKLALGELSELNPQMLQQQWSALSKGTPAEHARLQIRLISAEVQCMACFSKYQPIDRKIHCPHCGSVGAKILSGEGCVLESIEVDHD
jgi:hydrogenase nickel incorporation protein HypA/HybF